MSVTFLSLLRQGRRRKCLTQTALAEKSAHLSQSLISEWETGVAVPNRKDPRVEVVARVLELPLEEVRSAIDFQIRSNAYALDLFEVSDEELQKLADIVAQLGGCVSFGLLKEMILRLKG